MLSQCHDNKGLNTLVAISKKLAVESNTRDIIDARGCLESGFQLYKPFWIPDDEADAPIIIPIGAIL